jgi:hypothetical protein
MIKGRCLQLRLNIGLKGLTLHDYPPLLITHIIPPTYADSKTPTTMKINMTVTTLVNEPVQ